MLTLTEFYRRHGGDAQEVLQRLYSEQIVREFLQQFPEDGNYAAIHRFLKEKNVRQAFQAAHTLRGVCLSLGLADLHSVSAEITEALRDGRDLTTAEMLERLDTLYEQILSDISQVTQRR